ncbi:protein CCSMST1 [Calypte anna]|uniref:protein CCSMST1 n=1 Tax=Calypte anna TaxID=9244 RepID=UPI0011C4960D|nr:protein CCSMST1 [Calypte anna]
MSGALGRWRAGRWLCPPVPRRWLARRGPEGADPEGGHPLLRQQGQPAGVECPPFHGSDHERPWGKVLPLSLLGTGLLLWCLFRERTEIDERLEAAFSGQMADSGSAPEDNALVQLQTGK